MSAETIQLNPSNIMAPSASPASSGKLSLKQIQEVINQRKKSLHNIQPLISRKFFYALEEKLDEEEKQFMNVFNWQQEKKQIRSRYSLILDTQYFEQRFL